MLPFMLLGLADLRCRETPTSISPLSLLFTNETGHQSSYSSADGRSWTDMGGVLSFPYTYWKDTRSFSTMDHRHHGPQNYQHDIEASWCMLSEAEAARFHVITQRTFHEPPRSSSSTTLASVRRQHLSISSGYLATTKVVITRPHNGTFSSELHQRNDDNLELA